MHFRLESFLQCTEIFVTCGQASPVLLFHLSVSVLCFDFDSGELFAETKPDVLCRTHALCYQLKTSTYLCRTPDESTWQRRRQNSTTPTRKERQHIGCVNASSILGAQPRDGTRPSPPRHTHLPRCHGLHHLQQLFVLHLIVGGWKPHNDADQNPCDQPLQPTTSRHLGYPNRCWGNFPCKRVLWRKTPSSGPPLSSSCLSHALPRCLGVS